MRVGSKDKIIFLIQMDSQKQAAYKTPLFLAIY